MCALLPAGDFQIGSKFGPFGPKLSRADPVSRKKPARDSKKKQAACAQIFNRLGMSRITEGKKH